MSKGIEYLIEGVAIYVSPPHPLNKLFIPELPYRPLAGVPFFSYLPLESFEIPVALPPLTLPNPDNSVYKGFMRKYFKPFPYIYHQIKSQFIKRKSYVF